MTTIIRCIRKNERWINLSYYVLYAILYLSALVGTTTFMDWEGVPHVRNLFYMGATAGMLVLWMLGIVLQENWKVNATKAVILLIGILQFAIGGGSSLILILTILIGATDRKSGEIILKESIAIGISVVLITYLAATNGFIMNHVSWDERHSFGFIYYSHFSDKILYIYIMYRCIQCKRMSLWGYACSVVLVFLDYYYTKARTVTICFVLFLFLCGGYDFICFVHEMHCESNVSQMYCERVCEKEKVLKIFGTLTSVAYLFASALSFGGIYLYKQLENMVLPIELDTFMTRINFSSEAMEQYGFSLFGQNVYESLNEEPYFYLDNAYIRLFFITGAVTLAFFLALMTWMMWHSFVEKRYILLFALLAVAIGGLSETYTINFYYNVFAILVFARLDYVGMIQKREKTVRRHRIV